MGTLLAFMMGAANRGREMMVFDWHRAAELIRDCRPNRASAGLARDWEYTGGPIYADGKPVDREDSHTYLASTWARPQLDMDGDIFDCYVMENEQPDWDAGTYWPDSALAILQGGEVLPERDGELLDLVLGAFSAPQLPAGGDDGEEE